MMVGVGSAFPAPWIWVLGLSRVLILLLDPELKLDVPSTSDAPCSRCHLNSLSFLSPPRSSLASTWGISVVSVFPCPSTVLWDPGVAGRAGGFPLLESSLCSQLGTSVSSRDPELPQIPIPVPSDPTPAQERDVHCELWSPAMLEQREIHGMSGNLLNSEDTTAFSELSGSFLFLGMASGTC